MTKHVVPAGEDGQNPFAEMLAIMDVENLIRFRQRLKKVGRKKMVRILTEEIEDREKAEKEEHQALEESIKKERKERKALEEAETKKK